MKTYQNEQLLFDLDEARYSNSIKSTPGPNLG